MITVFGSVNVDMVMRVAALPEPGETVLCPEYLLVPGGKGANQALAAARAGAKVRMVGRVGRDAFADVALSLLKEDGVFQAGIPSEGGFLWWLGWRCTTGMSYWLRNGLDFGAIMRHEHLSTAPEIIGVVRHFFDEVRVERHPLPLHDLSLSAYIEARGPKRDVAAATL